MPRLSLTLVVLLLLSTAACGGSGGDAAEPADAAAVSIASPEDGATVPSTFQVAMEARGLAVEPAGEAREGAGHFHLIVDAACVAAGEQIPADETHIHLADGSGETELTLPAGAHRLCLQAGDGTHTALGLTDEITINVGGDGDEETTTQAGEGPAIAEWRGGYEGEVVWDCGPAGSHRGTLEAGVELFEFREGAAVLNVEHTVTGSCADTGRRTTAFTVNGKRTDSAFTFPSDTWGVPGTFRLRIDGDRVEGRLSGPVPGPGRMTIVFDLECFRDC